MNSSTVFFFFISLISLSFTTYVSAQDFCVADPKGPQSPSGFSCKDPSQATADDFAFTGLAKAGNTSNLIKAAVTPGFAPTFAGINGLGISVARLDFAPGGVIPLHTHPAGSEVIIVIKGTICTGFISSTDNKVYIKTLKEGESMVFPRGLLHFQINTGKGPALAFVSLSSPVPGLQILPYALFKNDLPSEVIEATALLSDADVKRLKALLGGTG